MISNGSRFTVSSASKPFAHATAWCVYGANLLIVSAGWGPVLLERLAGASEAAGPVAGPDTMAASQQWVLLALAAGMALACAGEMGRYRGPGGVTARLGVLNAIRLPGADP
ncbi:MAG TPA: hypothetical protein PLR32_09115, partial [candidate division Zixibacteria bacterium]|nr:hypothetical protein [candidate division Zixibacteria bacterium]